MPLVPLPTGTGGGGTGSGPVLWDGSQAVTTRPAPLAVGQMLIDTVTHRPIAYAESVSGVLTWVTLEVQRTYVGDGPMDFTTLDAAHNWGMPAGTLPDPVINPPAANDIYIDTHSGNIIVFN